MALSVRLEHAALADGALVARWRELAVLAENPFAMPDWHDAWLRSHPGDESFVAVCREADGAVAGVVPLVRHGRRGRRRLFLAGELTGDWFGPACAPADERRVGAAVAAVLGRSGHGWDTWELDRVRAGGDFVQGIAGAAGRSGLKVLPHRGEDTLVSVDLTAGDGGALVKGKRRREIDRLHRRLCNEHEVVLRMGDASTVDADLDALLRLRVETWGEGFDPGTEAFQRAFARGMAEQGHLRLWVLEVDGEPGALLYGWRLGGRTFAYIQAFSRELGRHGVGMWLLARAVADSAGEGCDTFDMLRGDEDHKARFHAGREAVECHRVVRWCSPARVEAEAFVHARAAYRRLTPERRDRLRRALRIG